MRRCCIDTEEMRQLQLVVYYVVQFSLLCFMSGEAALLGRPWNDSSARLTYGSASLSAGICGTKVESGKVP